MTQSSFADYIEKKLPVPLVDCKIDVAFTKEQWLILNFPVRWTIVWCEHEGHIHAIIARDL